MVRQDGAQAGALRQACHVLQHEDAPTSLAPAQRRAGARWRASCSRCARATSIPTSARCPLRYAYIEETEGDARVVKLRAPSAKPEFKWSVEAGHSVPTSMPFDPASKAKWGSAAADQALLILRAGAARTSPLPSEAGRDLIECSFVLEIPYRARLASASVL